MRLLPTLALLLLPTLAHAQVDQVPGLCAQLDSVEVQTGTDTDWQQPGEQTPLLVTPAGDSARVYVGDPRSWICKVSGGGTYVSTGHFGVYEVTDLTVGILRKISGDRTSGTYVGVFDHPLRYAMQHVPEQDREWAGLPTDILTTN
jgi:hypothetical protein